MNTYPPPEEKTRIRLHIALPTCTVQVVEAIGTQKRHNQKVKMENIEKIDQAMAHVSQRKIVRTKPARCGLEGNTRRESRQPVSSPEVRRMFAIAPD